jgi:hypothetical protein
MFNPSQSQSTLCNVSIVNPITGHVLTFDGAQWVNQSNGGLSSVITDGVTIDGTGTSIPTAITLKKVYTDSTMSGLGTSVSPLGVTPFSSQYASWRQSQSIATGTGGVNILQDNTLGNFPTIIPSNLVGGLYTVVKPGVYHIDAVASFTANATGIRSLFINWNLSVPTVSNNTTQVVENTNTAGGQTNMSISGSFLAAAGDTFRILAAQNTGGNLSVVVSTNIAYIGS